MWKKKTGGNWGKEGRRACNHFFKELVAVYQVLVYPLIGQIWQVISTLSNRVVPITQKDGLRRPRAWNRRIHDNFCVEPRLVLNECLRYLTHIGALRKEKKTCLVNLARGKDVYAILPTGFGLAWSQRGFNRTFARRSYWHGRNYGLQSRLTLSLEKQAEV